MNKQFSRIVSLLLTIVLLSSFVPELSLSASAKAKKVISKNGDVIYFDNSRTKFETVYCYSWNSTDQNNSNPHEHYPWPGKAMKRGDYNIWSIEVPANMENVIFSNGKSGGDYLWTQSVDLDYPGNGYLASPSSNSNYFSAGWSKYGLYGYDQLRLSQPQYIKNNSQIFNLQYAYSLCSEVMEESAKRDCFTSFMTYLNNDFGIGILTQQAFASLGVGSSMTTEALDEITKDYLKELCSAKDGGFGDSLKESEKEWKTLKTVYSFTKKKPKIDKKNTLIKEIGNITKKEKSKVKNAYEQFEKKFNKTLEGSDELVAEIGIAFDALDCFSTMIILGQIQKETVKKQMDVIAKMSNGKKTELYKGLKRMNDILKNPLTYCLDQKIDEYAVKAVAEAFTKALESSNIYTYLSYAAKAICYFYEKAGGYYANNVLEATIAYSFATTWYSEFTYAIGKDDEYYALCYEAYVSAVKVALSKMQKLCTGSLSYQKSYLKSAENKIAKYTYETMMREAVHDSKNKYNVNAVEKNFDSNYAYFKITQPTTPIYPPKKALAIKKIKRLTGSDDEDNEDSEEESTYSIPYSINGLIVEELMEFGFNNLPYSTVVTPDCVKVIGRYAFLDSPAVNDIILSQNLEAIREGAFQNCTGLNTLVLPDSLETVEFAAFRNCQSLTNVTFGEKVNIIGDCAFEDCTGLEYVRFENPETEIGTDAFKNCPDDMVIYGFSGSTAESFASENGFTFIENPENVTELSVLTLPDVLSYSCGDEINSEGLTLKAKYKDNTEQTVSDGFIVSGQTTNPGKIKVNVYYQNARTSFEINVSTVSENRISISDGLETMFIGEEYNLNEYVTIAPENVTNDSFSVVSSDEDVISVDGTSVTALKQGTATITVFSESRRYSDSITVNVQDIVLLPRERDSCETFLFTAPESGKYTFSSTTGNTAHITLYNTEDIILEEKDSDEYGNFHLESELIAKESYFLVIDGIENDSSDIEFTYSYDKRYRLYFVPDKTDYKKGYDFKVNILDTDSNYHDYYFDQTEYTYNGVPIFVAEINNPDFDEVASIRYQTMNRGRWVNEKTSADVRSLLSLYDIMFVDSGYIPYQRDYLEEDYTVPEGSFFLAGYINGSDDYGNRKFENGKLTCTFTSDSYLTVRDSSYTFYYTEGWLGTDVSGAELFTNPSQGNKLYIPQGTYEISFLKLKNSDRYFLSYHNPNSPSGIDQPSSSEEVPFHYYVTGDAGLTGTNWKNGKDENTLMTYDNKKYTHTFENVDKGFYEYKIIEVDDSTGENIWHPYNGSNSSVNVERNGSTVIISLSPSGNPEADRATAVVIPPECTLADVNKDGKVNIQDVTCIQRYLVQAIDFDEEQAEAADVDCNDKITIRDATLIQLYLVNVIHLPLE